MLNENCVSGSWSLTGRCLLAVRASCILLAFHIPDNCIGSVQLVNDIYFHFACSHVTSHFNFLVIISRVSCWQNTIAPVLCIFLM